LDVRRIWFNVSCRPCLDPLPEIKLLADCLSIVVPFRENLLFGLRASCLIGNF
jgi:hypothetical protein